MSRAAHPAESERALTSSERPAARRPCALAISIAAVLILALAFVPSAAAFVYWANNGGTTIGRANLDGTGANQSFITGASNPAGWRSTRRTSTGPTTSAAGRSGAPTSTARA